MHARWRTDQGSNPRQLFDASIAPSRSGDNAGGRHLAKQGEPSHFSSALSELLRFSLDQVGGQLRLIRRHRMKEPRHVLRPPTSGAASIAAPHGQPCIEWASLRQLSRRPLIGCTANAAWRSRLCFPDPPASTGEAKIPGETSSHSLEFIEENWSGRRDSNPRPRPWQGL